MLCEDGGKRYSLSQRAGYAVYLTGYVALGDIRFYELLGLGVHLIANVAGTFDGINLLYLLSRTHLHHRLDQLYRGRGLLL